ncbi:glycogenin glucosyltransferase [Arachnomyces sp. PD_36]|nr:glycogenin glucosyltransferase [Arachnomyces sp. PD_36]
MAESVYCTLLLSDNYLPGAMVLAHSLRDCGTRGKLVALVTLDSLQTSTVDELKTIYDEVIPVKRYTNSTPANLFLMDRPDLISAFTKIELWRQTQFDRIVYLDADIVALRAPDELLNLDQHFAAAPDIGWPDCFNTGVMVLRPNLADYYALMALAKRGISFDGADQGLLNMHFRDWHRLSFTYNCTPSGNYQYLPAYRHFGSTISMVHYIGQQKPWNMERLAIPFGGPYNELLGRWWEVYDRHYRPKRATGVQNRSGGYSSTHVVEQKHGNPAQGNPAPIPAPTPQVFEQHQAPAFSNPTEPQVTHQTYHPQASALVENIHNTQHEHSHRESQIMHIPTSNVPQYVRGEEHITIPVQHDVDLSQLSISHGEPTAHDNTSHVGWTQQQQPPADEQHQHSGIIPPKNIEPTPEPIIPENRPKSPPKVEWDASRDPPPINSKPEAIGLQTQTYSMSRDTKLFQPPESYPEAPKDMYYDVPPAPPVAEKLRPIFPWEEYAPKPTRVFPDEPRDFFQVAEPTSEEATGLSVSGSSFPRKEDDENLTPTKPQSSVDPWESYTLANAWDEVPAIEKYVQAIHKSRKAKAQVIFGTGTGAQASSSLAEDPIRRPSMKITDFPTEIERPSLPVTPAPMRRSSFWGSEQQEDESAEQLPAAEGVPKQEEWNPLVRLEELQRRQVEFFGRNELSNLMQGEEE